MPYNNDIAIYSCTNTAKLLQYKEMTIIAMFLLFLICLIFVLIFPARIY